MNNATKTASEIKAGDMILHMGVYETVAKVTDLGGVVSVEFQDGRDVSLFAEAEVTVREARAKNPRVIWNGEVIGRFLGCNASGLALIDCPEAEDMDTTMALDEIEVEGLTTAQALAYVPT
jgi:hypothetical protein